MQPRVRLDISDSHFNKIIICLEANDEMPLAKYLELQHTENRLRNKLKVVEIHKQKVLLEMNEAKNKISVLKTSLHAATPTH